MVVIFIRIYSRGSADTRNPGLYEETPLGLRAVRQVIIPKIKTGNNCCRFGDKSAYYVASFNT